MYYKPRDSRILEMPKSNFLAISLLILSLLAISLSCFSKNPYSYSPDSCNEIRSQLPLPPDIPKVQIPNLLYQPVKVFNSRVNLGIGHLSPDEINSKGDWKKQIRLPIFNKPGSEPTAWIINGWFINSSRTKVTPFNYNGMVETAYESPTFIAYQIRKDGWIKFRHSEGPTGIAWTHQCLISSGKIPLSFKSWEQHFNNKSPMYFRSRVRHSLREEPSITSTRLQWVPAYKENYHFKILEVRDDWMRIEMTLPSDHCSSKKVVNAKQYQGWVKWKDEQTGPWIWYYTRGC